MENRTRKPSHITSEHIQRIGTKHKQYNLKNLKQIIENAKKVQSEKRLDANTRKLAAKRSGDAEGLIQMQSERKRYRREGDGESMGEG